LATQRIDHHRINRWPQRGYLPVSRLAHWVSMPHLRRAASALLLRRFRQRQLPLLGSMMPVRLPMPETIEPVDSAIF